jgi:transcriptional regulator with XRE-family HTH domain
MALQNQEIAARLRELRGTRPQTFVADEMGVSERTLQNWESGATKPNYRSLQLLAEYYGVGEEFILTGGRRSRPRPVSDDGRAPELFPVTVNRLDGDLENRITSIEGTLAGMMGLLREARSEQDRISGLTQQAVDLVREARTVQDGFAGTLREQTSLLRDIRAATREAGDAADRLDEAVERAATSLRSAAPARPAAPPKTSPKRTPRAVR